MSVDAITTIPKRSANLADKTVTDFVNNNLAKSGFDFGDVLKHVFGMEPPDRDSFLETLSSINTQKGAPVAMSTLVRIMECVAQHPERMELLVGMSNLGSTTYKHSINLVILKYFMTMPDPVKALDAKLHARYRFFPNTPFNTTNPYDSVITKPFLKAVITLLEQRIETAKARKA